MFEIKFFKELSKEEQDLISATYCFLGKKVVWDILRLLLEEPAGLTQDELKRKLNRRNISNVLNCMIELGLVVRGNQDLHNPMCRGWIYYLDNVNLHEHTERMVDGYNICFKKHINNPKSII